MWGWRWRWGLRVEMDEQWSGVYTENVDKVKMNTWPNISVRVSRGSLLQDRANANARGPIPSLRLRPMWLGGAPPRQRVAGRTHLHEPTPARRALAQVGARVSVKAGLVRSEPAADDWVRVCVCSRNMDNEKAGG